MSALFVALGIMVLALLALLLWFVPHLLQQQATRVAGETTQLREMLLDLLNEQESVTIRQGQLNASLSNLQDQLSDIASAGNRALVVDQEASRVAESGMQQLEARLGELQGQIKEWADGRQYGARQRAAQDNECLGQPDGPARVDPGACRHALAGSRQCDGWPTGWRAAGRAGARDAESARHFGRDRDVAMASAPLAARAQIQSFDIANANEQ